MSFYSWVLLVALSVVWGSAFLLNEIALVDLLPFSIVFGRVILAAAVLFLALYSRGLKIPRGWPTWRLIIILALIHNAVPFTLVSWGQKSVTSSLAAILMATVPLWSVIAAPFFLRDETLNKSRLIGVILGFIGVIIIIGIDGLSDLGSELLGQLAILLAAFLYTASHILGRHLSHLPALTAASCQLLCASFFMFPFVIIFDKPWNLPVPGISSIMAVIALAISSTALAFALYYRFLALEGALNVSLVAFLIPVVGVLLGAIILDEHLTIAQAIGMIMISLSILIIDGRPYAFLANCVGRFRKQLDETMK